MLSERQLPAYKITYKNIVALYDEVKSIAEAVGLLSAPARLMLESTDPKVLFERKKALILELINISIVIEPVRKESFSSLREAVTYAEFLKENITLETGLEKQKNDIQKLTFPESPELSFQMKRWLGKLAPIAELLRNHPITALSEEEKLNKEDRNQRLQLLLEEWKPKPKSWWEKNWKEILFWGFVAAALTAACIFTAGAVGVAAGGGTFAGCLAGGGSAFSSFGVAGCIETILGSFAVGSFLFAVASTCGPQPKAARSKIKQAEQPAKLPSGGSYTNHLSGFIDPNQSPTPTPSQAPAPTGPTEQSTTGLDQQNTPYLSTPATIPPASTAPSPSS